MHAGITKGEGGVRSIVCLLELLILNSLSHLILTRVLPRFTKYHQRPDPDHERHSVNRELELFGPIGIWLFRQIHQLSLTRFPSSERTSLRGRESKSKMALRCFHGERSLFSSEGPGRSASAATHRTASEPKRTLEHINSILLDLHASRPSLC